MIRILVFCIAIGILTSSAFAAPLTQDELKNRLAGYGLDQSSALIVVDVSMQKLSLYEGLKELHSYSISTSAYGTGSQAGSMKTPLGLHRVKRKIGARAATGTIFKGRVDTGRIARIHLEPEHTGDDFVTSRILWLDGMEPGENSGGDVDSYRRYIYIHGTHEEGLIGQPASHGCIRMRNADVIELFDLVPEKTPVWIRG